MSLFIPNVVSRLMGSTAPAVNMNMAGMNMNMPGMNMNMNMNMSAMSGIGAACGMPNNEPSKPCGVQFPLHAQRRKRRVLFTQAQVSNVIFYYEFPVEKRRCCRMTNTPAAKINIDALKVKSSSTSV